MLQIHVYIDDTSDTAKEVKRVYIQGKETLGGGMHVGDTWFRFDGNGVYVSLNSILDGVPKPLADLGLTVTEVRTRELLF